MGAELEYRMPFPDELCVHETCITAEDCQLMSRDIFMALQRYIQKVSSVTDSAPQLSQDVTVDASFLCGKALCFHQCGKMLGVLK
jgi:ferredoxin